MGTNLRLPAGLVLAYVLGLGSVEAMPILDFARMNLDDQATFVTSMVEGSAKTLRSTGHADQAQKLVELFKNSTRQGGVNQLAMNLKTMAQANNLHATNPNNRIPDFEVEDAMQLTLRDNGIIVSAASLETITRDFHPMFPPRPHVDGP
jgi:hypothetical protein